MSNDFMNDLLAEHERLSQEKGGKKGGNDDFLKNFVNFPATGAIVVRLLGPAPAGMFERDRSPFFLGTRIHRINERSFHCPRELSGQKWLGDCPICSHYSYLWQESEKIKDKDEQERMQSLARSLKARPRFYYNAIVRDENSNVRPEPKILSIGEKLHKLIINKMFGNKEFKIKGLGNVADPERGRDLVITKTLLAGHDGESYPDYSQSHFVDEASPLGTPDEIEYYMAHLHDLVALRTVRPVEELKHQLKIHLGLIPNATPTQGSYDPSEFQPASASAPKVTVTSAPVEVSPAAAAKVETPSLESLNVDPTMTEDEFLEAFNKA